MRKLAVLPAFLLVVIALVIVIGAPPELSAQSSLCDNQATCSVTDVYSPQCGPTLPPGVFDCQSTNFIKTCLVHNYHCPPPAAAIELTRCLACEAAAAGKPINLATGDVYIDQVDMSVPGLGGGLKLVRSWNSLWPNTQSAYRIGIFGPNWRSNYEERIFVGDDGYIKYLRSDGNFWSFGNNGANWLVAAPGNASATLTQTSTQWVLIFKNGEQRVFDLNTGMLQSITDRNGNTTTLSYDGLNRLITVTDPASRHLTFTYAGPTSYLVTGVSSDTGISLSYSYDGNGRLLQVTKPDQSTLSFEYDPSTYPIANTPNPFITAVKDGSGKILEAHTYDCYGRGLSSSRAGGVEAITVAYSDSTYTGSCGAGRYQVSQ